MFKRLLPTQKARILRVLSRGIELGKRLCQPEEDRSRSVFTKHQTEQLSRLFAKVSAARARAPQAELELKTERKEEEEEQPVEEEQEELEPEPEARELT